MIWPPPFDYLDPGIREVVRRLVNLGFITIDSGDGVSKPDAGRILDVPHVFMLTERHCMTDDADRLEQCLPLLGCEGWSVEANYHPRTGEAMLLLLRPPVREDA